MFRTDLALEAKEMVHEASGKTTEIEGVKAESQERDGLTITTVDILNENGKKALGKEIGRYITIELPPHSSFCEAYYRLGCIELKKALLSLLDLNKNNEVLVVGLGNREITPDALGSLVLQKLIVTRHLKTLAPDAVEELGTVSGIAPGVMGMTGIETVEIIKGILEKTNPSAIIVIDALASRSTKRIGTTIQLCNTGISPGSGIGNTRKALNSTSLGIPVIAIGVPMVVDAATIAFDAIYESSKPTAEEFLKNIPDTLKNMIVTPKEIDKILVNMSAILSGGINTALHPIPLEELSQYTG